MALRWSPAPAGGGWSTLGLFGVVAVMYGVGAEVAWHSSQVAAKAFSAGAHVSWLSFSPEVGFAFFSPSGISVAAMLLTKQKLWPVIITAIVAAELVVDAGHGVAVWAAIGLAAANALEPLVGASLVRAWCKGTPDLRNRGDLARFVAGACVSGPLVGGLVGAAVGAAYAGIWWPAGVLRWLAGDGLGALVLGAPILVWPRQRDLVKARRVEVALVSATAAALSVGAFWVRSPPGLLVLPLLAWAAFRLEVIGAALAGAVLALGANLVTAAGRGSLAALDLPVLARLAVTQLYLAVLMLVALLIGQEAAGRVTAVKQRQAEQRERNRLQTLARLGELLATALTPEQIGEITAAQVGHDAGAEAVALGLLSADGDTVHWVYTSGYPPAVVAHFGGELALTEPSAASDAIRTGNPVLIGSLADYRQRYPQTGDRLAASGAVSLAAWPLGVGDRPIGVLELMWQRSQPLDAAQQAYASAVATMVTQAVIRAQIYVDEHARASVLQAAVLPTGPSEVAGLEIAVCYEPAGMPSGGVGGDWWDAMPLPKERTYLAVGDVVGHGLPAVEDMAQMRAAGRALAVQGLPPAQLLAELNIFTAHATNGRFATMTVAIFDSTTSTLHYGSAGHPPALLRRADSGEVIRLGGGRGPVLGPLRDAAYDEDELLIAPGDVLVIYTDGLVERRGEDLDTAITQAQEHLTGWASNASLHDTCQQLTATVALSPREDDVCVLAIKFGQPQP